jgi:hypothetical protein
MRDEVSHPYKTTGKIIVLYTLIFIFTEDGKVRDIGSNCSRNFPNLICS